jgi:uncharacterized membrane protein YfcA
MPPFPTETAAWFLLGGAIGITGGSWGKNLLPAEMLRRVFAIALVVVAGWVGVRAWAMPTPEKGKSDIELLQKSQISPS